MDPALSPDGLSIVFVSERSGDVNLWICRADGSNPRQLINFHGAPSGSPQWSPDGKTIAFDNPAAGQLDIYITNPEGTYVKRITQDSSGGFIPAWSRDGKWIYYCSQRSGRMEIWKTQLTTGVTKQVTTNGGYKVRESIDGRFLYYTKSDSKQASLWRRTVEGGLETVVIDSVWTRRFEITRDGIYFQSGSTTPEAGEIAFLNFSSGVVSKVAAAARIRASVLAAAPDGSALLLSRAGEEVADLMLVDKAH